MRSTIFPSLLFAGLAQGAITLNGQGIPGEGLPLLATQSTHTEFGNSLGGGQNSIGGSELNQIFASLGGSVLELGITGNLEGNFNKIWIFFDATPGGENILMGDNVDGGFNEIGNLAGIGWSGGFTADHGIRIEIGNGFYGINAFDLIDNTAFTVASGSGPGALPLTNVGSGGITLGWDNSNILGVDNADASGAPTATTGWEFSIDLATFFGITPTNIGISTFITSADAAYISNQTLPGLGAGAGNLGAPEAQTFDFVSTAAVPEPSSILFSFFGLALLTRRIRPITILIAKTP